MTEQRGSQHPAQPDDFEPNPEAVRRISAHLWGEDFRNLKAAVESFPNGYTVVPKEAAASAPTPAEPLDVLLHPVITYLEHFVNADEAEADGFDVAAWCDNARALLARSEAEAAAMSDEIKPGDQVPNEEQGILDLLDDAFEKGIIVIFGAAGMTVEDIIEATHGHRPGVNLMIIGEAHQAVPGDKTVLN